MAQTILVIEDEPQIVAVVRGYLTQAGFEVISATDGRTGLFMAQQQKPNLVLLDLMLPMMDGLDVARAIRQSRDPLVANVALIMLTARVEESEKRAGCWVVGAVGRVGGRDPTALALAEAAGSRFLVIGIGVGTVSAPSSASVCRCCRRMRAGSGWGMTG